MRRLALALVLLGCTSRAACPPGDLTLPSSGTPAFAVRRSDNLSASAIALLDAHGTILEADFIDSGTRAANLVTTLAGDLALPSSPLGPRTIGWIGRFEVDVLTFVHDGVTTEVDLRGETLTTPHGFTANPQDALLLSDQPTILVTRQMPNDDPSAPDLQRGNDVVVVANGQITRRIALGADAPIPDCRTDCTALARPAALLELTAGDARAVVVVLSRLNASYTDGVVGAVVTIDPATWQVSAPIELEPYRDCLYARVDPTNASRAYVLCEGPTFTTEDVRLPQSGIVELVLLPDGTLAVTDSFMPSPGDPAPYNGLVALGDGRVLYVAAGNLDAGIADRLVDLDMHTGTLRVVYGASTAFVLGDGTALAGTALVPDAARNAILRFHVGTDVVLEDVVAFDDCIDLPPRQIAPLSF